TPISGEKVSGTIFRASSPGQAQAGPRPLAAHVLAKLEELRRASARRGREAPRALDQAALLDEPAEILLMEPQPDERLDRALQLRQREGLGQQLEHDRPIRELPAQSAERARRDAAVVVRERGSGAEVVRRRLALVRVVLDEIGRAHV